MGHDDRERRRLALQASILNPFTEQLLRRAGIASGMRVLDLGCGVGDVSLIAGRLAGRHGQVIAIDMDNDALAIGRQRAAEGGLNNISFQQGDVLNYHTDTLFDAVTGRHILLHAPDPLKLVQVSFALLNPGGVAAFQEYDFSTIQPAYPESPLRDQTACLFRDFFGAVTQANPGAQLYHLLLEAGFSSPDCRVEYPMDGGPDSPYYEWLAESVRSILPRAEELGLLRAADVEIDTLAQRLKEEAVSRKSCVPAPLMVGGFARKRSV